MGRTAGVIIENQWTKGLVTEATGLNFPEHSATDADNVKFLPKGSVVRRKGIDIEGNALTLEYEETEGIVKEFVWNAVAKTGGFTFLVLQKGSSVNFFELEDATSVSSGVHSTSLPLESFKVPGAGDISVIPCSFASGGGYLFIAHPLCDPILVRWDETAEEFEAARVSIFVRDFDGVNDALGPETNPTDLTDEHHYNLRNQGWDQQVRVGNVSNEIGEGGSLSPPSGTVTGVNSPPIDTDIWWSRINDL